MLQFIKTLFSKTERAIALFSAIITIAAIIYSREKRPFYIARSLSVNTSQITKNFPDKKIKIHYQDNCKNNDSLDSCHKQINSITSTKMMFWNGGRKTIDKNDIEDNPIIISAKDDTQIIGIALLNASDKSNNVSIANNKLDLSFLESGDGFVLEVLHTGSSHEDIIINGYIRESKFQGNFKYKKPSELSQIEDYLLLIITYILIISLSYVILGIKSKQIVEYLKNGKINSVLFYFGLNSVIFALCLIIPLFAFVAMRENSTPYFLRIPESSYNIFESE